MKIDELIKKLENLGVSRDEYSLFESIEEKYCLVEDKNFYSFFYLEKPQKIINNNFFKTIYKEYSFKSLHKWFDSEERACDFFHKFFVENKFIKMNWKFIKIISDREKFKIKGINIWDYEWKDTGMIINIRHPKYEQSYLIDIYEIEVEKVKIEFATTEFSNCAWGVCVPSYLEDELVYEKDFSLYEYIKTKLGFLGLENGKT
jgi:hypothetical protein